MPRSRWIALTVAALTTAGLTSVVDANAGPASAAPAHAASAHAAPPSHAYRANDYADGRAMSILPPGENGLVNTTDLAQFELNGTRPPNSQDQLGKYDNLLYGHNGLADSGLSKYYNDESFGVRPADITRTEQPNANVTIYRDKHDVPHIYGNTDQSAAFGAGYAQAEDRLFLMDVLRNYGEGTLAQFLGSSCAFEQMDHDQLLLAPYTKARAIAQVDNLPKEYGKQGALAKSMIYSYVDGVNAYIAATKTNPSLMPADYAAAAGSPRRLGCQRRGRDRRAHRRHLRQGRRPGDGQRAPAAVPAAQARLQGRHVRVRAVPHEQRSAGSDDVQQVVPVRDPGQDP